MKFQPGLQGGSSVRLVISTIRNSDKTQGMRFRVLVLALVAAIGLGGVLPSEPSTEVAAGSETQGAEVSGLVWERHGDWHLNGSSATLRLGEAVPPGGLLTAGAEGPIHSMTILLPDGQRMLCECYEAKTCSQGFRVPAITPRPRAAVWDMFVAVRNILLLRPATAETPFTTPSGRAAMAGNFEMVEAVSPQGEISIAPALRALPPGQYSLGVSSDGAQAVPASRPAVQPLNWTAGQKIAQMRIAGPGLYRIRVSDQTYVPRIEIEVLATPTASLAAEAAALKDARETILGWMHVHEGWSLHDFLRVYLQSRETSLRD
jgi:hypothetical protein